MKLQCLVILLLTCVMMPTFAYIPSGGVLSLDGVDDYAVLPFTGHGYLFRQGTREFTVELWFYPRSDPNHGENRLIFSQQVYFGVTAVPGKCRHREADEICCYGGMFLDGEGTHGVTGFYLALERDRWNYVALLFKEGIVGRAYNNRIVQVGRTAAMDRITAEVRGKPKDFFVGGYADDWEQRRGAHPTLRFHGEIDAIRFSRVARYALPDIPGVVEPFQPPQRFLMDRDTVALWNFDERPGTERFQDETARRRTLIGMNGAETVRSLTLPVHPSRTSLTATWSRLKSESY